jgi:hypothetical protein
MVSGGASRLASTALVLGALALAVFSADVSANPIVPGPDFSDSMDAVSWLFFSNFPIDLFWFTVVLYFAFRWLGVGPGKIAKRPAVFAVSVLVAALLIAVAGALIDFYAFYDGGNHEGYTFWADRGVQLFGSTEFFLALIGVFAFVYLAAMLIVRMDWRSSLMPAAVMTALNPLAWVILFDRGDMSWGTLVGSALILAIISFVLLTFWHIDTFERDRKTSDRNEDRAE